MRCKICIEKEKQIEYLQSLIADLRKDNQLLLDRLLIKNNSAPIVEPEPEVPPTNVEGEVYGVDE